MDQEMIASIASAKPDLRFCQLFDGLSPLWNYTLHKHPYVELIYRKRGFGRTMLAGGEQKFSFFDTIVYPVGCYHQDLFEPSADNEAYCLWLEIPCVTLKYPLQVKDRDGKLEFLFRSIYDESQRVSPSPELLSLLMRALLLQIMLFSEEKEPTLVEQVVQYINFHLAETFELKDLADLISMSISYLTKSFKKEMGMSVVKYLNCRRTEAAQMMLITTSKSVEDISEIVGYDSPKYFSRVFKSFTGMSPAAFRRQHIAKIR